MFKKMTLRLRITVITCILLSISCIFLTGLLNRSGTQKMYTIQKTTEAYMVPKQKIKEYSTIIDGTKLLPSVPKMPIERAEKATYKMPIASIKSTSSVPAKIIQPVYQSFQYESLLYMLLIILGGGLLTYYISGKMLRPVKELSEKIENVTAHNLSEKLETPKIQDEIYGLTKSFNTMIEKLERAFNSQKQFSANAAHELRTPLAVLQTKLDVFEKEENHNIEDYIDLISAMKKHTTRLSNLIISLLEISNLEEIPMQNNTEVYSLIDEIFCDLEPVAEKNTISLSLTGDKAEIIGDDTLLYRGFYNIIENAIKYNSKNGEVHVDIQTQETQVIVKISDTGIGIPTEMKEKIFDPFVRVNKSRSRKLGGAGLGLAITNEIIKKHGGGIEISDNIPKGTIFTVLFKGNNNNVN